MQDISKSSEGILWNSMFCHQNVSLVSLFCNKGYLSDSDPIHSLRISPHGPLAVRSVCALKKTAHTHTEPHNSIPANQHKEDQGKGRWKKRGQREQDGRWISLFLEYINIRLVILRTHINVWSKKKPCFYTSSVCHPPPPPHVSTLSLPVLLAANNPATQAFLQMCVCVCVRPLTPQLSTQHCCLSMRTCVTVCMCANASASHGDQQWELKGQSQHSNTHQTRGTIAFCSHVNVCATPFMCKNL